MLVFVDADVVLAPLAVAAAVDMMAEYAAICPYPKQLADTATERLVQPLLQWSWLTFLPLAAAERSSRPSLCAANGQFLVITREAYDEVGGHAAVRNSVLEDLDLFRALKRADLRGLIADGTSLATCRMYQDWSQLRDGYAKSLWSAFGSPARGRHGRRGVGSLLRRAATRDAARLTGWRDWLRRRSRGPNGGRSSGRWTRVAR